MLPDQRLLAAQAAGQQAGLRAVSLPPGLCGRPPSSLLWTPRPVVPPAQSHCGSRQDTSKGPAPTSLVGRGQEAPPARWLPPEM